MNMEKLERYISKFLEKIVQGGHEGSSRMFRTPRRYNVVVGYGISGKYAMLSKPAYIRATDPFVHKLTGKKLISALILSASKKKR